MDALVVLGRRPQLPGQAGVVEDATGEVVAGGDDPHGPRVMGIGEALENAGQALAGAAGDAYASPIGIDAVVACQPPRQALAQRLVPCAGAVLQGWRRLGRVRQDTRAGGRQEAGGQDVWRGPAAHQVDGPGLRSHGGDDGGGDGGLDTESPLTGISPLSVQFSESGLT